jgi:hypothetical protein
VIYAVRRKEPSDRQAELVRARQILWGRPLWWMHSVGLTAALELRDEDGCEPLATEIAAEEVRHHLLDFADHPALAAAWRLQRAQIPLIARTAGHGPLVEVAQSQAARLSAAERLKAPPNAGHVLTMAVRNVMRSHLRKLDWFPDTLNAAAEEAESVLARLPIPPGEWHGPLSDPWLQSWAEYSPLVMCGLAILSGRPLSDDLLDAVDLRQTIYDAATSEHEMLRRPAIPLAERLGLF